MFNKAGDWSLMSERANNSADWKDDEGIKAEMKQMT